MEFSVLSQAEYLAFVETQERCFYTQLPSYGSAREASGITVERVGLKDSGRLVAAALITYQPWKKLFRRAVISYGPVLDWDNSAVVEEFFRGVLEFLSAKKNVLALRVNPLLKRREYEDVTPGVENPAARSFDLLVQSLDGHRVEKEFYDDPSIQIRFAYTKDIGGKTYKEAAASCGQVVRTRFNRKGNGVEIRFLGPEDIDVLARVLHHTAERTDMHDANAHTIDFYRELLENMGPDEVFMPVAVLNCPNALADIAAERSQCTAKVAEYDAAEAEALAQDRSFGKKQRVARKETYARIDVLDRREKEIREVQAENGDEIELAASFFIHSPHELVYLVSGAYAQFQNFSGVYLIHRAMFEWATERDVRWYNMFGISGDFSDEASDAGVLHFKRQFNGNVEEYAGTYDIPIHARLAAKLGMMD